MLQFPLHDGRFSVSEMRKIRTLKSQKIQKGEFKVSAIRPCIESFEVYNQKAFLTQTFPFESVHRIVPHFFFSCHVSMDELWENIDSFHASPDVFPFSGYAQKVTYMHVSFVFG